MCRRCINITVCLLLVDMDNPQGDNPWKHEFREVVSYPAKYYSRPPQPAGYGSSAVGPRCNVPGKPTTEPTFQMNFQDSVANNSVQRKMFDNKKTIASAQNVDVSVPAASIPTPTSITSDEMEQLKCKPGEGPLVDLRLLVPGKVH